MSLMVVTSGSDGSQVLIGAEQAEHGRADGDEPQRKQHPGRGREVTSHDNKKS